MIGMGDCLCSLNELPLVLPTFNKLLVVIHAALMCIYGLQLVLALVHSAGSVQTRLPVCPKST